MELWDAYDDRLRPIEGVTLVRGEPVPEGMFHLVCEVAVRRREGNWLLMKRAPEKPLGGAVGAHRRGRGPTGGGSADGRLPGAAGGDRPVGGDDPPGAHPSPRLAHMVRGISLHLRWPAGGRLAPARGDGGLPLGERSRAPLHAPGGPGHHPDGGFPLERRTSPPQNCVKDEKCLCKAQAFFMISFTEASDPLPGSSRSSGRRGRTGGTGWRGGQRR